MLTKCTEAGYLFFTRINLYGSGKSILYIDIYLYALPILLKKLLWALSVPIKIWHALWKGWPSLVCDISVARRPKPRSITSRIAIHSVSRVNNEPCSWQNRINMRNHLSRDWDTIQKLTCTRASLSEWAWTWGSHVRPSIVCRTVGYCEQQINHKNWTHVRLFTVSRRVSDTTCGLPRSTFATREPSWISAWALTLNSKCCFKF